MTASSSSAERHSTSLALRLVVSLGVVVGLFLGLTGLVLDRAFVRAAEANVEQWMESQLYALIRGSDLPVGETALVLPEVLPDPRYWEPGAGLYAAILGRSWIWESNSATGYALPYERLSPGERRFAGPVRSDAGDLYVLAMGVTWERPDGSEEPYTFIVLAGRVDVVDTQARAFRRNLWLGLGLSGLALLIVQLLVLRLGLAPLRRLEREVREIERGTRPALGTGFPRELSGVTTALNGLITTGRELLERSRKTLGDLAHSLRTPLTVIQSATDSEPDPERARSEISTQVRRMTAIIDYQLRRAAMRGHQLIGTHVQIEPLAAELVAALERVHQSRAINCGFDLAPTATFPGESGDLTELLGNLLENAFKWAKREVLLSTRLHAADGHRTFLELCCEDDGPGVAADQVELLVRRGVRGDEKVQGHGIGLSIVDEIVRAYHGELIVDRSPSLGGARFTIRIPPL